MKQFAAIAVLLVLSGCAFQTSIDRAPGAPELEPSPFAELLRGDPPEGAVLLGTVGAQGNNWQNSADCESELINAARRLGANAVLTAPASSTLGRGPSCEGKAYLVP